LGCSLEVPPKQTPTPAPTPTPTPTPIPTSQRGTLSNPASMNEKLIVKTLLATYEITALEFIRGEKANQLIARKPDAGYEYLLVKVRVRYASGETPRMVSAFSFNAYAEGESYNPEIIGWPKDMREFELSLSLHPGNETEGWLAFIVPVGKEVLLAYKYKLEPIGFIRIG
jgi:hypothetical protein